MDAVVSGFLDTDSTMPVAIGSQPLGTGPQRFKGFIDDVRIYNRALNQPEIADLAELLSP